MPRPKQIQSKKETTLVDENLAMAIRKYHAIKAARKQIQQDEEDLKTNMVRLLLPYTQEFMADIYLVNGAKVSPVQIKGRSTIHPDKLMEQGVDPEVIGNATTIGDPYTRYDTGEE